MKVCQVATSSVRACTSRFFLLHNKWMFTQIRQVSRHVKGLFASRQRKKTQKHTTTIVAAYLANLLPRQRYPPKGMAFI